MGFSPRLLLKSSFRSIGSNNGSSPRLSALPSTSTNGTPCSIRRQFGVPTNSEFNPSSPSFSSLYSSNSSLNDSTKSKAASEILTTIAEKKICVVRKYGAQEETLVNSIVDGLCKPAGIVPIYLTVSQQTACQLLDLFEHTGLPLIFVNGNAIGGVSELLSLSKSKFIAEALQAHDYDIAIIGGGQPSLVAAQEASLLGKKVVCIELCAKDSSLNGTTCLKHLAASYSAIDCLVPKQMFLELANFYQNLLNAQKYGFDVSNSTTLDWQKLQQSIGTQITKIVERYQTQLKQAQVEYICGNAEFTGTHEVTITDSTGRYRKITADKFLIAAEQFIQYPNVPNIKEFCITAEEFLMAPTDPGKTLCVGDSILSFELAGILRTLGVDVTILSEYSTHKILDHELLERLRTDLLDNGVKFQTGTLSEFSETNEHENRTIKYVHVLMKRQTVNGGTENFEDDFNTIILATDSGATDFLKALNIQNFGTKLTNDLSRVETQADQCVGATPNIYAIGACAHGFPRSTLAATVQTARALMKRFYRGSLETVDVDAIPKTIFTSYIQYAFCGLSEEIAVKKYGIENISIFKKCFGDSMQNYCKIICHKCEQDRILGVHILAAKAGLLIESVAVLLKFNAHKVHLDNLFSINPTFTEMLTNFTERNGWKPQIFS